MMTKIKYLSFLIIVLLLHFSGGNTYATQMANYCSTPPFLTGSIPPNILFVIDVSGSMTWSAYNPDNDTEDWCDDTDGCGWTYEGDEEGYFVPDKNYVLVGDCNSYNYAECYWTETTQDAVNGCPYTWQEVYDVHEVYKGSCLNFLLMARIDLLRWALTGGRPESCNGSENDPNCDPNISCTGSTCMLETYYGDKVVVPTSRINGILQTFENESVKPRFGALFYGGDIRDEKVYIGDYPYSGSGEAGNADPERPYTNLKRFINAISPSGGTPTGPAMWEAYDYFKQANEHYYGGFSLEEGTYKDPNYFCDANKSNCKPVPCAKNFVILASDGQWNSNISSWSCSIENGYENNSTDPVVPTYKMHADVLRVLTSLSGTEYNINVSGIYSLGLFLGGTGEQSLKNIAVYGSFDTNLYTWPAGTDGSHWNGDGAHYPWDSCYMNDCGNGRGSACTPLPPSSPDWDSDNNGIPDNFLNAKNAIEIKNSLLKFIRNILKKTSSGTSISVLTEKDKRGAIITQAIFYDQKYFGSYKVDWIGRLYTYWFMNTKLAQNIREDTVEDKVLNILEDRILTFYIDSTGNLEIQACESDTDGNPTTSCVTKTIDEIAYLWDAGEVLSETEPEEREIYTPCSSGEGCDTGRKLTAFTQSNLELFASKLGTDINEFPTCLGSDLDTARNNLVKYVRGTDISGCRSRSIGDKTWKLGDIIYSTPKIVDYSNYAVVFTSSNDGILHAFKVGKTEALYSSEELVELTGEDLGKELWGFIPSNALPYLRYLADPNYCHLYINDLSPYIIKVDYDYDNIEEIVLIGGLRLGGACGCDPDSPSCNSLPDGECCVNPPSDTCPEPESDDCLGRSVYYALDISDPTSPKFLWEFTDPRLGFSYSGPAFIRRYDPNSNQWKYFVMFVSGPTHYKGYSNQDLMAFILDLPTGTLLRATNVASLNSAFGGRLFTNGLDVNLDGQTDYVFFGYVRTTDPNTSDGGVVMTWTGSPDPNDWLFDNETLNFAQQPITAKIEFGRCFGRWYLFFGTGRFFYKEDNHSISGLGSENLNALYGVPFNCDENYNCETGTINPVNIKDDQQVECDNIGTVSRGAWMVYLDGTVIEDGRTIAYKERDIADPSFAENIVFFATTQPTADLCGFGGYSRAWAINCATGDPITSDRCPGYIVNVPSFKYLLQLSGGNIEEYGESSFTEEGGLATEKAFGITSEQGGLPIFPNTGASSGEILLWIER